MIKYKEREIKLRKTTDFTGGEAWYSWLINDWILSQPDSEELMILFIELEFSPMDFVKYVVSGENEPR